MRKHEHAAPVAGPAVTVASTTNDGSNGAGGVLPTLTTRTAGVPMHPTFRYDAGGRTTSKPNAELDVATGR